ncbi:MAG TPA: ABC transporter ATP-binding protein [Mycobacteriales bacterium]|nr:ABC transporter ATP-binding protein [Mycobacteriales bacterium]
MREWLRGFALWIATGFRAAPLLTSGSIAFGLMQGLIAPLQAYGLKLVVDGLTGHDSGTTVTAVMLLAVTFGGSFLLSSFEGPLLTTVIDKAGGYLHTDLIRIITGIPAIVHHEQADVADRIELLHRDAQQMSFNVMQLLMFLIVAVNLAAVVTLLVSVDPLLLLLLVAGLPRIVTTYIDGRLRWTAARATAKDTRLVRALQDIAKAPENAVETRVFGLQPVLLQRIDDIRERVETLRVTATWRGARYEIGSRILFGLAYGAAIAYVAVRARGGAITPGGIALIVLLGSRIEQVTGGIASATRQTGQTIRMFGQYAWLRRYAADQSWADATEPAPILLQQGISLRGVGFSYPGNAEPVLRDIDLDIPAGTTIALVGENGAGKSTLVKLLGRLYDPTAGAVLVEGTDLRQIDPAQWRECLSAGFQDFVKFEFAAGRAVGLGDLPRVDDGSAIDAALVRGDATAVVEQLPDGRKTQLGKRFTGGVDLSGGQWQRLSLARGFMRDRPLLLLLDEPTAALDPEAEHTLFERFAAASREAAAGTGGITVLVSHRFSTVRNADLIVVLDRGRIVEQGSHADLVRRGGRYAELFDLQARAYR